MAEVHSGIPRLMWESEHEWLARKHFIDSNMEFYNGDRLGSLSMAWANWKFMGCSYGPEVQAVLEDCHSRVPSKVDEDINILREKAMKTIKFVKSKSDELGTRVGLPNKDGKQFLTNIDFNLELSNTIWLSENQPVIDRPVNQCLTEEKPIVNQLIPGLTLWFPSRNRLINTNYISVLHESTQKCRMKVEFTEDYLQTRQNCYEFRCTVVINGQFFGSGNASTKKEAKRIAAESVCKRLETVQPVFYRDEINHEHITEIQKEQLVKLAYMNAEKISETSVGGKLLKKMGWTGSGGVGKNGDGIVNPVFFDSVEGRRGVGHQFVNRSVKKTSVEDILSQFLRDPNKNEMKFSADLTREDRTLIHSLCQKHHLRHKSFGKNEQRYLVVSK